MALKKVQKTAKEFSIDEKAKKLHQEIVDARIKDEQDCMAAIQPILNKYGCHISARMILEHGKAPLVQPMIAKTQK